MATSIVYTCLQFSTRQHAYFTIYHHHNYSNPLSFTGISCCAELPTECFPRCRRCALSWSDLCSRGAYPYEELLVDNAQDRKRRHSTVGMAARETPPARYARMYVRLRRRRAPRSPLLSSVWPLFVPAILYDVRPSLPLLCSQVWLSLSDFPSTTIFFGTASLCLVRAAENYGI